MKPIEVDEVKSDGTSYSICTLVTDRVQYDNMVSKYISAGFTEDVAEYIYVDNVKNNKYDGYHGLRKLINASKGKYVIICHEDIEPIDKISQLDNCISQLTDLDPAWGICGNAGGIDLGKLAIRITDPHGEDQKVGSPFPKRVFNLDENFVLLKRDMLLAPSCDLSGFHFYGTDLCLQGYIRGCNSYVIDFHIRHMGGSSQNNNSDDLRSRSLEFRNAFPDSRKKLIIKYSNLSRSKWFQSTNSKFFISSNPIFRFIGNRKIVYSVVRLIKKIIPENCE